jgi:hypothetical protein
LRPFELRWNRSEGEVHNSKQAKTTAWSKAISDRFQVAEAGAEPPEAEQPPRIAKVVQGLLFQEWI